MSLCQQDQHTLTMSHSLAVEQAQCLLLMEVDGPHGLVVGGGMVLGKVVCQVVCSHVAACGSQNLSVSLGAQRPALKSKPEANSGGN